MTDERMALAGLLEKWSDSDLLREMIGYVAQRLMQLDVEGLVGAARGERGEGCENRRKRLPGAGLAYPERHDRAADSEAAAWHLVPGVPGAAALVGDERWRQSCRKPASRAFRRAPWTSW